MHRNQANRRFELGKVSQLMKADQSNFEVLGKSCDPLTKDPELAASKLGLTLLCPGSILGCKSYSRFSLPVFVLAK